MKIHQGHTFKDRIYQFEGVSLRVTHISPNFGGMSRYVGSYHRYITTFSGEVFPDVFWLKIAPDTSQGMSGLSVGITEAL